VGVQVEAVFNLREIGLAADVVRQDPRDGRGFHSVLAGVVQRARVRSGPAAQTDHPVFLTAIDWLRFAGLVTAKHPERNLPVTSLQQPLATRSIKLEP